MDFSTSTLHYPLGRASELHFLLRAIAPVEIVEMRRAGRLLYQRYFATDDVQARTVVDMLR